jgi:hypothetical protein
VSIERAYDFSFAKKAGSELTQAGWKPLRLRRRVPCEPRREGGVITSFPQWRHPMWSSDPFANPTKIVGLSKVDAVPTLGSTLQFELDPDRHTYKE